MPLEIEAKIKVDAHEPVVEKLQQLGAERVRHVKETNQLFDDRQQRLRQGGSGLRIRHLTVLDGSPASDAITYKGPVQQADLKIRPEVELAVGSADQAKALLEALGYSSFLTFEKYRQTWHLGGCKVELDELPLLGLFVEIEGPTDTKVLATKEQIGLGEEPTITKSYVHMLLTCCKTTGVNIQDLRFER